MLYNIYGILYIYIHLDVADLVKVIQLQKPKCKMLDIYMANQNSKTYIHNYTDSQLIPSRQYLNKHNLYIYRLSYLFDTILDYNYEY